MPGVVEQYLRARRDKTLNDLAHLYIHPEQARQNDWRRFGHLSKLEAALVQQEDQARYDALLSLGYFADNGRPTQQRDELAAELQNRYIKLGAQPENLHRSNAELWQQAAQSIQNDTAERKTERRDDQAYSLQDVQKMSQTTRENTQRNTRQDQKQELVLERSRGRSI